MSTVSFLTTMIKWNIWMHRRLLQINKTNCFSHVRIHTSDLRNQRRAHYQLSYFASLRFCQFLQYDFCVFSNPSLILKVLPLEVNLRLLRGQPSRWLNLWCTQLVQFHNFLTPATMLFWLHSGSWLTSYPPKKFKDHPNHTNLIRPTSTSDIA
jgi:hypothetical protein